ncbi:cyclic lactone autoinducer peptide [Bacillus sp. FJAT-27264]|nr:cyclic lactone autoinducer peptide [Bacillus sp. FJAT-27264]
MKKTAAKLTSSTLSASARFFASVLKIGLHSPEIPKELRK